MGIADMVVAEITRSTTVANEIAAKISANTTDEGKLVHEHRVATDSTDEQVVAFQEWFEKANALIETKVAEINAYIKANLLQTSSEPVDLDALREQYKAAVVEAKTGAKFLATLSDAPADYTPPAITSLRGGTVGSGNATGQKRPRVERIWIDGNVVESEATNKAGETRTVSNFTLAAAALSKVSGAKVEVKDLQAAAFSAAGTDDLNSLNGEVFEFSHSSGDKNYAVKVQPKIPPVATVADNTATGKDAPAGSVENPTPGSATETATETATKSE